MVFALLWLHSLETNWTKHQTDANAQYLLLLLLHNCSCCVPRLQRGCQFSRNPPVWFLVHRSQATEATAIPKPSHESGVYRSSSTVVILRPGCTNRLEIGVVSHPRLAEMFPIPIDEINYKKKCDFPNRTMAPLDFKL